MGISEYLADREIIWETKEALKYLETLYGCLANALYYLHKNDIRHKDLKPRNILLTARGPYIADFGQGRDLSELTGSTTDGIDRGTYNYCAPEVAQYKPRGRPSDIYSMGCVFLEISTILHGRTLESFRNFRRTGEDGSYHGNPEKLTSWMAGLNPSRDWLSDGVLLMISSMLANDPEERPTARQVALVLYARGDIPSRFHGLCCQPHEVQLGYNGWFKNLSAQNQKIGNLTTPKCSS